MKTRNPVAAARLRQREPLPHEAASQPGLRRKAHLSRLICYYINSCLRPLDARQGLFLFIKAALALQSWSGGHCPARMAARLLVFHRFDGPAFNALCIAGIVLIGAGLLGVAVGSFGFSRSSHRARPDPQANMSQQAARRKLPVEAKVAAVAVAGTPLFGCQQGHDPHFVLSRTARGPPAASRNKD